MADSTTHLLELIPTLTLEERHAVEAFIAFLKERAPAVSPEAAFDEFVREHSGLLQLLAQ
jgi:hypothetical protein